MRESVREAASEIHKRFSGPITLNDIASKVFVSPFHLSRVFTQDIGVPPGRYLTAVRMFEAKKLLVTSSMTVCDIVYSIGYNSVGTFTSRFRRTVGMSPRQYRCPDVERLLVAASNRYSRMPSLGELSCSLRQVTASCPTALTGTLRGVVELPHHSPGTNVLVGVYREAIPQQTPVAHLVLPAQRSTRFTLSGVPVGQWTVMAIAMPAGTSANCAGVLVGSPPGRVTVNAHTDARTQFTMRHLSSTDAPIAVTLARTPVAGPQLGVDHMPALALS